MCGYLLWPLPAARGALISERGGRRRVGAAPEVQNAANSLGQASGPLLGGALFVWQVNDPFLLTAALLVVVALAIARKGRDNRTQPEVTDHAEARLA